MSSSPPPISIATAHVLTSGFAIAYVGSLYVYKRARLVFVPPTHSIAPGQPLPRGRDNPDVIRARLTAVCTATALCCAAVVGVLWRLDPERDISRALAAARVRLGVHTLGPLRAHLITPALFLGPLFVQALDGTLPLQAHGPRLADVAATFGTLVGARNYALGPLTEEVVFRACVLAVYALAGAGRTRMIVLSPLSFGLAHAHHAWETYNRHGRTRAAAQHALIATLFQLTYTTLFGVHCAALFLRTGALLPPATAHVFCNLMGVPQLGAALQRFPRYRLAIVAAYVLGIVAFATKLGPWSRGESIYWPAGAP